MPDTDFDDLELLDDPESDTHVRLNKADVERLRKAAKQGRQDRKELEGLKRRDAITTAGLSDLTEKQRSALATLVEDATPENLRAEAEALGWVQPAPPDPNAVSDAELAAHDQVAAAGAGAASAAISRHVTQNDLALWSTEKLRRLDAQHPDLYELCMRGEEIDLPPTFVL